MKINWNLRMLCAEKGIWTGADLGRRLWDALGLELTPTTLSKLLTGTPKSLSLNVLLALCVALDCKPNDLLVVDASSNKRAAKRLVAEISSKNHARAPLNVRGGRKKRRVSAPPPTRI